MSKFDEARTLEILDNEKSKPSEADLRFLQDVLDTRSVPNVLKRRVKSFINASKRAKQPPRREKRRRTVVIG